MKKKKLLYVLSVGLMALNGHKIKGCLTTFIIVAFLGFALPAFADVFCARPDGYGFRDGGDWNNAVALSEAAGSSAYRGHTIYITGEHYGSILFNAARRGSNSITIKKATASDHVTGSGWNAEWGEQSAIFTRWTIDSDNWEFNGQVGQGADAMYGVPSSAGWKDHVPYGIRVLSDTTIENADICKIYANNITIRHTEMGYTSTPGTISAWGDSNDIIQIYPNHSDITISYCWLHDASRVNIAAQFPTNFVVEHSVIERCGQAQESGANEEHTELYSQQQGGRNTHFRYNLLRDWKSTGGLILHSEAGAPGSTDFHVYGNVFTTTGYYDANSENGVIGALSKTSSTPHSLYVYNNTFVDVAYGCQLGVGKSYSAKIFENNIFYNCHLRDSRPIAYLYGSHAYNWFFNSGSQSETGIENGTADIFVDRVNADYRLSTNTSSGRTLAATYGGDPLGNTRAADGIWDRGAFEYPGIPDIIPPSPPTNFRVVSRNP